MNICDLFPHEKEALLDALRRDLRNSKRRIYECPDEAIVHHANVRLIMRVLDVIQPRTGRSTYLPVEIQAT